VKSTNYEAPHYAVFFILPLFSLSWLETFSSALSSQTPLIYVLRLGRQIKFYNLELLFMQFKIHVSPNSLFYSYTTFSEVPRALHKIPYLRTYLAVKWLFFLL